MRYFSALFAITLLISLFTIPTDTSAKQIISQAQCQYGGCPSYSFNGCSYDFIPDVAIIKAGIALEGMKPTKARDELAKRLKQLKSYIADIKGATVVTKGTIRATNGTIRHPKEMVGKYILGEKIDILVPLSTDIDELLENLQSLGVNKIGNDWHSGRNYSGVRPLVLYSSNNFEETMETIIKDCKKETWENWCKYRTGQHMAYCRVKFSEIEENLLVTNFNIRGPQIYENNSFNNFYFNYPQDLNRTRNILFQSSEKVNFKGNLSIQLVPFFIK